MSDDTEPAPPTVPGWYRGTTGSNYMIFMLNGNRDWYAITASGDMTKCEWGYIAQAGDVELIAKMEGDKG